MLLLRLSQASGRSGSMSDQSMLFSTRSLTVEDTKGFRHGKYSNTDDSKHFRHLIPTGDCGQAIGGGKRLHLPAEQTSNRLVSRRPPYCMIFIFRHAVMHNSKLLAHIISLLH